MYSSRQKNWVPLQECYKQYTFRANKGSNGYSPLYKELCTFRSFPNRIFPFMPYCYFIQENDKFYFQNNVDYNWTAIC